MAWTEITRPHYRRDGLLYASDLTNDEWGLIEPFMPPSSAVGRPRKTKLRKVMEAILYMASTGCQWRAIPKEFPPYSTVQGYFYAWSSQGLLANINHMLVVAMREKAGADAAAGRERKARRNEKPPVTDVKAAVRKAASKKATKSGAAGKQRKGRRG